MTWWHIALIGAGVWAGFVLGIITIALMRASQTLDEPMEFREPRDR